jgi:hypothetical protein
MFFGWELSPEMTFRLKMGSPIGRFEPIDSMQVEIARSPATTCH